MRSTLRRIALAVALSFAPSAFAAHNEVRFDVKTVTLLKADESEKWEVTPNAGGTTSDESTKTESWDAYSNFPVIGFTTFNDGLVVGAQIYGLVGFVGGTLIVGKELSKAMEVGAYTQLNYSGSKKETETEAGGASAKQKSNDATRNWEIGPYLRMTTPAGAGKLELMPMLTVKREASESNSGSRDTEEKSGYGLSVLTSLVIPLWKEVSYVGDLAIDYSAYTAGEKVDSNSKSKLKSGSNTTLSLGLLGLRASL